MRILKGALASLCAAVLLAAAQQGVASAQADQPQADPSPANLLAADMDTQFNGPTSPLSADTAASGASQKFVTVGGDSAIEIRDSALGAANPSSFTHHFTGGDLMTAINDVYQQPVGSPARQFSLSFDLSRSAASDQGIAKDICAYIAFGNFDNKLVPRFPVPFEVSLTNTAAYKSTSGALSPVTDADIPQYRFTIVPNGGQRLVTSLDLTWEIRVNSTGSDEALVIDNPSVVELPDAVVDNQPPSVPTGLTKGQVAESSVSFSWSPSTDNFGVTAYDVYRDGTLVTSTAGATTLAVVGNLTASTTYQFTVRARDASGNVSAASAPLSMTTSANSGGTDPPPPPPLPNLLAADMDTQFNGPTSPLSTDTAASGASQKFVTVDGDSATEIRDSALGAANPSAFTHHFTSGDLMTAINDVYQQPVGSPARQFSLSFDLSRSAASDQGIAKDICAYIAFGNFDNKLVPRFPVPFEVSLTNTAAYKSTSGALLPVTDADIPQYRFTIVPNGGQRLVTSLDLTWEIRVNSTGFDEALVIDNPSVVELPDAVVDNQPPSVPTGLTKGQVAESSASFSWSPSTDNYGVTAYDVYRDGYLATSTTGSTTLAVVANLAPSTTYQFTVKARDASGNVSAASAPLTMTTGPHVPNAPAPFPGDPLTRSQWVWDETKSMLEEEGPLDTASYVAQLADNQNTATNLGKLDHLYQVYDAEEYKWLSKMYAYLMVGDQYSPTMLAHTNSYFAQYSYKVLPQTENLRMSTYVTGYLLGQSLPDVRDLDGNSGAQLMAEDKAAILAMIDAGVHSGWAEYESSEYTFMTYFGLNAIYQWANDPELVQKAKMAMDVMWFEWANDWIDGYRISTESRAKGDESLADDPTWRGANHSLLAWTYFGADRQQQGEGESDNVVPSAYRPDLEYVGLVAWQGTKYTPPDLAVELGQKTDKSYTSYKTNLQNSSGRAMDVYRTSYVRPTWGLGTEVQYRRVDNWLEDMPMVLRWQSDAPQSVFRVSVDVGNAQIGTYDDPNEHRVMQDGPTAVGVFKSSGDTTENYLSAMFPDTGSIVDKRDVDGWTLVNTGKSYFAFRMAQPATWYHQTPSDPSNKVKTTTQIHPTTTLTYSYNILRSQADRNGWVLDTADASQYPNLDAFATAITTRTSLDLSHIGDANPRLVYHSLNGDTLDLTYDNPAQAPGATHLVNGTPINYDSFKLFDTPYLQQDQLGDTFTATVDGKSLVYDFSNWTVSTPPPPVPDDAATTIPAVARLSSNNGWDTGLLDGDYTISANLWYGENASEFRLYENGTLLRTTALTMKSPGAQHPAVDISGRPDGTYVYTGELVNSKGVRTIGPLTVTVRDANPAVPSVSDDNWDHDGTFTVSANLWWGTNATHYRFFENGTQVSEGDLTAATPGAQRASLDVTGKPAGVYEYVAEFSDALGATRSVALSVTVQ